MLSPKLWSIPFKFRVHFIRRGKKWQQTQSKKLTIFQVYELINKGQYLFLCSGPLLDQCVLRLLWLHQYYYFSTEVTLICSRSPGGFTDMSELLHSLHSCMKQNLSGRRTVSWWDVYLLGDEHSSLLYGPKTHTWVNGPRDPQKVLSQLSTVQQEVRGDRNTYRSHFGEATG